MFCFCFRRSRFERIAITLQKVYLHCHSNKFSLHTIQISIQWDMIFYFEKSPNLQISCHRYSVPMEAALSPNHILRLSSQSDMLFHLVPFSCFFFSYMHYSQRYGASNTKGWDLEKWVRASSTRQLRKPWFLNSRFQHSRFSPSTNPKAPSWKTRTHMADGECCWMFMFFVASKPWRTAVGNLHSCRRNSFRMT